MKNKTKREKKQKSGWTIKVRRSHDDYVWSLVFTIVTLKCLYSNMNEYQWTNWNELIIEIRMSS